MKTNRLIESSKKLFAWFLNLYPRDHRADFAVSMQQVFSDQCRDAYNEKGAPGIILLWLRVLPDLGYTAVVEHLSSPRAAWGLMEPVPNAPLPWKGVFMILLPGLVYLVSQIAQINGQPWYMTVYYRAAFILILPVLAVWAITRRFPIWGLIPVGLLFRLVKEIGYQLIVLHPDTFSSNPVLNLLLTAARRIQENLIILVVIFFLSAIALAVWHFQNHKPGREVWIWLGGFLLISVFQIYQSIQGIFEILFVPEKLSEMGDIYSWLRETITWSLYELSAFLFLIFLGTLFTRRHGFFAILVMVGYIMPTIVVGLPYNLESLPNTDTVILIISVAVLAYRGLLSLIAPIWMSRTATLEGKKRAVILSIAFALVIHALMQFYPAIMYADRTYMPADWLINVLVEEARLVTAVFLAIVLYQNAIPKTTLPAESFGALPELTREQA
jgi:hypothetical protein